MTTCGHVEKHIHSPAQVLKFAQSADRGLVVFRRPINACISLSIFSGIELEQAFQNYIDFHNILLQHGKNICWANFDWFTKSPLNIIELLNLESKINRERIEEFKNQPDRTMQEVYKRVDDNWISKPDEIFQRQTARPNVTREILKTKLERSVLESEYLMIRLNIANSIFEKIENQSRKKCG
jgi:hypothetical protein